MRLNIIILTALLLTIQSCSNGNNKNESNSKLDNSATTEIPNKYTAEEKVSIISNMEKAMGDFSNETSVRDLDDAKSQLQRLGFVWYQCHGTLIEAKCDSSIWKMKDTATAVLSKYQTKMFPKYRKAFGVESDKKLWIEDCKAFLSGDKNENINLVGMSFAPNRYKQESYETLLKVLKQYRFKKITFRTFENSSNITSYDVTSDADTEYVPMLE